MSKMQTADNIIQDSAIALTKFGRFIKLTDENVYVVHSRQKV